MTVQRTQYPKLDRLIPRMGWANGWPDDVRGETGESLGGRMLRIVQIAFPRQVLGSFLRAGLA